MWFSQSGSFEMASFGTLGSHFLAGGGNRNGNRAKRRLRPGPVGVAYATCEFIRQFTGQCNGPRVACKVHDAWASKENEGSTPTMV
jgi:hypothetical protein